MQTLIVNTYAGSLLLGAHVVPGARILGSFEDCGFGAAITKANRSRFQQLEPDFQFVDHIKQWPELDLTETVILAHPPCAAFSQQNTSKAKRGVDTDAFECTRKVLKYGMLNGAAAICVESVPGALGGAWDVHEHMAETGGYHLYRVMKNSLLFGVPQFRERFWGVWVRKGLASPNMTWRLAPKIRTVAATLDPVTPGTPVEGLDKSVQKFIDRLSVGGHCICGVEHGFDPDEVRAVGLATLIGHRRRGFSALITPRFFPTEDYKAVCRKHVSPFTSGQPSVLAPGGFAPVLLGSSLWIYRGQPVSSEGYRAIMGFPTDYVFPPDKHYGVRTMLSKGVCPPVATWILENVRAHLGCASNSPVWAQTGGYVKTCEPSRIVSFRPGRVKILEHFERMDKLGSPESDELIPLRDEEEALES